MKIRHIVIIASFVLVNALILIALLNAKPKETEEEKDKTFIPHVEAITVTNTEEDLTVSGYGTLSSYNTVDLAAEVQGKLYTGTRALKPGIKFKKGELLFRIDDVEARYTNRARKSAFINLLANIMPDIKIDFASEYQKWNEYMESIKLNENLPQLPSWNSEKEKIFLSTRNILSEYFNIKSQEEQLKKFSVYAPFNGMISEVYMPEFSFVNPGAKIMKVVQTGNYEIPVAVPVSQLHLVEQGTECSIYSTDGTQRGVGSVVRISEVINRTTQSVTIYVKPGSENERPYIEGEYLLVKINAKITQKGIRLPQSAIKDNQVYVYSKTDSLLYKKPIQILNENELGAFVSGLQDNETVVIQEVTNYSDSTRFAIILK
ncbi:MAG: efflux RND transporter periplasmic adaptor subunit [Bacteroidetes bacterium]|nr:efflux RND transporter periplasmic adaptor subunit [Bacteroidota bacterium]